MSIFYGLRGAERKRLVGAISEILKLPAVYNGAPTFSYTVGDYIVDRYGTMIRHTGWGHRQTDALIAALAERGFEEAAPGDNTPEMFALVRNRFLSAEVPLGGFTELALDNLRKIIAGKSALIQRALGQGDLPFSPPLSFKIVEDSLCFPWFTLTGADGEAEAYTHFIHALCDMAKRLRWVSVRQEDDSATNDKFVMRLFLVRLGLKGTEYKQTRTILLRHLSGNSSWKEGRPPAVSARGMSSSAENAQAEDTREV